MNLKDRDQKLKTERARESLGERERERDRARRGRGRGREGWRDGCREGGWVEERGHTRKSESEKKREGVGRRENILV